MSTGTTDSGAAGTSAARTAAATAQAGEVRSGFGDLLAAEWLKLRSLRSMRWGVPLGGLALVALNADAAFADYRNWPHYDLGMRQVFRPEGSWRDAFTNNTGIALLLVCGVLGALAVVGEYASGSIRSSFAAVPARRSVIAAKTAVVAGTMLVFGALVTPASFWLTQAILSGRHAGLPWGYSGTTRGLLADTLLAPVSALVGLGLAVLIRHAAATVVAVVTVLLLVPNFLSDNHYWTALLYNATPFRAWQFLAPLDVPGFRSGRPFPADAAGSWWVLALWPLVAVVLSLVVIDRRDV
ncbi:ABC transporter permease subunit [Streptacidiphilus monticola]|uniref:ABC transporter permease subunit n=1 Tax=Streptacidiphilus monticola TaxID=2161674 RepID=A0ABW1G2Q3_9ACTN